jgi:hypothetical protein
MKKAQELGYDVFLDLAAYAPTNVVDFKDPYVFFLMFGFLVMAERWMEGGWRMDRGRMEWRVDGGWMEWAMEASG